MTQEAPIRVLHVAEAFGGGLLEMVRLIAEHSTREGQTSLIVHARRPETPDDPRSVIPEPIELEALDWRRGSLPTQLAAARRLRALVSSWRPDLVHLHSSFAGFVGAVAIGDRAPTIFTPNAFASALPTASPGARSLYRRLERVAVRRCTVVGAVSRSEADLADAFGARRVVVIPNGIAEMDAPVPAPRSAPRRRPRVMACGRIVAQRQPEACARILAAVSDLADVVWVGGGGNQGAPGQAARDELTRLGIAVTGWRERDEVLAEMTDSDVYLHWTAWDGLPFSVLEAMAVGTLVVASDIDPNRELLDPRQIASDEDAAVALLRRLLSDRAHADELLAAQSARRSPYSARAMCEAWAALYRELAATGR